MYNTCAANSIQVHSQVIDLLAPASPWILKNMPTVFGYFLSLTCLLTYVISCLRTEIVCLLLDVTSDIWKLVSIYPPMPSYTDDDRSRTIASEQNPITIEEGTHVRNELGSDHGGDKIVAGIGKLQGSTV